MEFGDWLKIAELGVGAASANKKSKQAMSMNDLEKLWLLQNPSVNTPMYSSTLTRDGDGGSVRNTEFTPEIQALFEQFVGGMGGPQRTYDSGMGELQNAQHNYQRSRHGLDAQEYNPQEYNPATDPELPNYGENNDRDMMPVGNNLPPPIANSQGAQAPISGGIVGGGSGGGTDQVHDGYQAGGGSSTYDPMQGFSSDMGMFPNGPRRANVQEDLARAFGDNPMGTMDGLESAENRGKYGNYIGQGIGMATGIPMLGQLGKYLGNASGNRYIDNHTFMSPVDSNDPYGRNAQQNVIGMEGPGWDNIGPNNQLPNSPMGIGVSGGYIGRNISRMGGGGRHSGGGGSGSAGGGGVKKIWF